MTTRRFTLGQFVGLCFVALTGLLIVLLSVFYTGSRRTILLASEQLMRQASRRVTERLDEHLGEAERLVAALESQAALGLVTKDTVEPVLLGALGGHPHVTDVTLTYGEAIGTYELDTPPHDAGDLRLAPDRSGQISVSRAATDRDGAILLRRLRPISGGWGRRQRGSHVTGSVRLPRPYPRAARRPLTRRRIRPSPSRPAASIAVARCGATSRSTRLTRRSRSSSAGGW